MNSIADDIAYWLGYNAFVCNIHWPPKKVERNFYLIREWQRGYNDAYFDNNKGSMLKRHEVAKKIERPKPYGKTTAKPFVQATQNVDA